MNCVQGGPADRAGIREGDELVEIDGISLPVQILCFREKKQGLTFALLEKLLF
jgi:C-terminal processing protease CtpA/Prc